MGNKYEHLRGEIQQLYESGKSFAVIGEILGIDSTTVARYLRDQGLDNERLAIAQELRRCGREKQKENDAIQPEEIAALKWEIQPGDVVTYQTERRSLEDERLVIPVKRKVVVLKKLPHSVIVGYEGEKDSTKTITYIDLAIQRRREEKRGGCS